MYTYANREKIPEVHTASQHPLQNPNFIQTQENPKFEKMRKSLLTNRENTIRGNGIEESNLLFVFFFTAFYLSLLLLLSLSLSSPFLCRAHGNENTLFFFFSSRLTFPLCLFFFFFCRTWTGPITGLPPTISPSNPWREAHWSSSHHLVSKPTSQRQSSSLSFGTIFVSMSDGFLSVWIFFSFIC
jgi:hypothetical protein